MKSIQLSLYLCLSFFGAVAQIPHLNILCSDSLAGRGYVHNGDKKASDYIQHTFRNNGLTQIQEQQFEVQVNVFPDSILLKPTKAPMPVLGKDYIISPTSKSFAGNIKTKRIDPRNYTTPQQLKRFSKQKNKAIVYHRKDINADKVSVEFIKILQNKPLVIELTDKKTMMIVAKEQAKQTKIIMKDSVFQTLNKNIYLSVKAVEKQYITQNVIGVIEGSIKDSVIIVCAHYDHLGQQGQSVYRGANDNATGTSALLQLAKRFGMTKPTYTMVFIAFGAEEIGLKGSFYYVNHPIFPLNKTKYVINLDLLGAGSKGITLVNGKEEKELSAKFQEQNQLLETPFPKIKLRTNAPNSDHYPFTQKGVSAVFLYSLGTVGGYHHIDDTVETLEKNNFKKLVDLLGNVPLYN